MVAAEYKFVKFRTGAVYRVDTVDNTFSIQRIDGTWTTARGISAFPSLGIAANAQIGTSTPVYEVVYPTTLDFSANARGEPTTSNVPLAGVTSPPPPGEGEAPEGQEVDAEEEAAPAPPAPTAPQNTVDIGGTKYTRTGENSYTFTQGGVTYEATLNRDGTVTIEGGGGTANFPATSTLATALKGNEGLGEEGEGGGSTRTVEGGGGGAVPQPAPPEETMTLFEAGTEAWYAQVDAAGGWVNWWTGGPFTNTFATLGSSWFGESWTFGRTFDLGQVFTINYWAEDICTFRHLNLQHTEGAIVTSPSGKTYAHMEGERVEIDPCMGVESVEHNASCATYYTYKISGEVAAAEVPMTFRVYLIKSDGSEYNIYDDIEDGKVALEQGELLSLAGANMFYFDSFDQYDKVCISFDSIDELREVFGAVFGGWGHDTSFNPLCQDIVKGYERDYQQFEEEEGAGAGPGARPNPPRPSNPDDDATDVPGLADEDRPGLGG